MQEKNTGSKLIPILIFSGVIFIVALYGFIFLRHKDDIIQGQADVTEIRMSSKVPGRIAEYFVVEGDWVKKGDTLAILSIPEVDAKLYQAEAVKKAAAAKNMKVDKGSRVQVIQSAYEMWQKALAGQKIAEQTYNRVNNLYNKGVATAQSRDEAEANLNAMKATAQAAKAQYDLAVDGAEKEDKEAAQAMVQQAAGAVDEVESYIKESYLIAPIDGRIVEKYPNKTELVGAGSPIISIADYSDKWGSFNITEDKLKGYKVGEKVKVFIPALDKETEMQVYYMKDMGSYAAWKSTKALGQYDRKTFEVRARFLNNETDVLAGMTLIIKDIVK